MLTGTPTRLEAAPLRHRAGHHHPQAALTQAQSDEIGAKLERLLKLSWTRQRNEPLPGDPSVQDRPNLILATHRTPAGDSFDLSAVAQQWSHTGVSDQPEIYLRMATTDLGLQEFNTYRRPQRTVELARIRQSSQPLAGSDLQGNPFPRPLDDSRILDFYMNPTGDPADDPRDLYFVDLGLDPLGADPSLAFSLINLNNLNGLPQVPGVRQADSKPGRTLEELHTPPSAYTEGLVSQADIDVMYVLSRIAGARFVDNQRAYGSRMAIWRGPGVSELGTEYVIAAWITDPETLAPDVGYFEATITIDWERETGRLVGRDRGLFPMKRTGMDLPANMSGGTYLRRRPNILSGEQFSPSNTQEYLLLGNLNSEIFVDPDRILPAEDPMRILRSFRK